MHFLIWIVLTQVGQFETYQEEKMPPLMPVNKVEHKDPQTNKQFLKLGKGSGDLWK